MGLLPLISRRVLDVAGELNRPRQSHAQVHGGSHEGSSRPQRRSRFSGGTGANGVNRKR